MERDGYRKFKLNPSILTDNQRTSITIHIANIIPSCFCYFIVKYKGFILSNICSLLKFLVICSFYSINNLNLVPS